MAIVVSPIRHQPPDHVFLTMRRSALAAFTILASFALGALAAPQAKASSGNGPGYYEALLHYCYKGGLAERIGGDPESVSRTGLASKRAALRDLRGAMGRGETAMTALCAAGYYRAIQAGYVTVYRDDKAE